MSAVLLLALALPSAAVMLSTGTAADVAASSAAAVSKPSRPMHAVIHREAKDWKPLALKTGEALSGAETKAVLRQAKVKGRYKGTSSKAKASARLYKAGDDRWLVVRVFPKELEPKRRHFEVRLKIVEGFVEEAQAAIVTVLDPRPEAGAGLDSYELRDQGVEFEEDSPASGTLVISALDPRPSKSAVNAGTLKLAAFGDEAVGLADASWSVKGLPPPK
jgi:hypothetical protein